MMEEMLVTREVSMATSKASNQHRPRRHFPLSEKRRIVELTLHEGASIRSVAREQGVNRNSLYQWQALYRAGKLNVQPAPRARAIAPKAPFLPVMIAAAGFAPRVASGPQPSALNIVQLTLASGATLRIETGTLDAGLICALVAELRQ
jgi:transposase-like protein